MARRAALLLTLCVWVLLCLFLTAITAVNDENQITVDTTVNASNRLIFKNKHPWISYVNAQEVLKTNSDLTIKYKLNEEDPCQEVHGAPQYFADLKDEFVEQEVRYRIENKRWSDRVVLEKLYFGLLFGRSGYPNHYFMTGKNYDSTNDVEEKFERYVGWDIFKRDEPVCEWTGVGCKGGKVRQLLLNDYDLKGTLSEDIQYLTDLDNLQLQGNSIRGKVPTTLSKLSNLKDLTLAFNLFTGTLPRRSLRIKSLESVYLAGNQFSGTLPRTLMRHLPNLRVLDLSNNTFVGTIPETYSTEAKNLTRLYLELNHLSGTLPEDVSGLGSLEHFYAGNSVDGKVIYHREEGLWNLVSYSATGPSLESRGNQFKGQLPTGWMSLPDLRYINIEGVGLSGTIPTEVLTLSNLEYLNLARNKFTGPIPSESDASSGWRNVTELKGLRLNDNSLSGTIPMSLLSTEMLINLDISNNNIYGSIPDAMAMWTSLRLLHAQHNRITGTLPVSMAYLNPSLDMNLTDNLLVGTVPRTFCGGGARSTNLLFRQFGCDAVLCPPGTFHPAGAATLDSGCRPCPPNDEDEDHDPPLNRVLGRKNCPSAEFVHGDVDGDGSLSDKEILRMLWVYTIGGNWGAQYATWGDLRAGACDLNGITCIDKKVVKINLGSAALCSDGERKQGKLEECLGLPAELSQLKYLRILIINGQKFLHATIPTEFGQLRNLQYLDLGSSPYIGGTMPTEIGLLQKVKVLNLAGCHLSGTVPEEFFQLTNIEKLHLSMNLFTGTISTEIGSFTNLKDLMWSRCMLSGQIPSEVGNLVKLENFEFYGNQIAGPFPSEIGNLSNLKRIDIFNNKLTGPLPGALTELTDLQILHAKSNLFTGTIPAGLGELEWLSWFDVSTNRLIGTIPASFGASRSLKDFRLGGNMLYAPIPQSLCLNTNINGGLTRLYGCDGVICPLGTYSDPGHAIHGEGCKPCPDGETTLYLGSSECVKLNDRDILAIFYNVMGGSTRNTIQRHHWNDPDVDDWCKWNGITCDDNGELSSIRFPLIGLEDPNVY